MVVLYLHPSCPSAGHTDTILIKKYINMLVCLIWEYHSAKRVLVVFETAAESLQ